MTTAKDLDDMKARVDSKRDEVAKVKADLAVLEKELQKKALGYFREVGLPIPSQTALKAQSAKSPRTEGTVNEAAKALITKMIGKKNDVEIRKPEKETIAEKATCSVADVEQTLKAEFVGLPVGEKGRKSKYGLKR